MLLITGFIPGPWRSHPSTCMSTMTRPVDSGCNSILVSVIGKSSETLAFTRLFHVRLRVVNVREGQGAVRVFEALINRLLAGYYVQDVV